MANLGLSRVFQAQRGGVFGSPYAVCGKALALLVQVVRLS